MPTKDLGRMQGTPWHVGFITKKENDPRRHRSRCSHYRTDGSCRYHSHCIGSAHCADYEDTELKKQKEEYKKNRKTWKELAPAQADPNIVQLDDVIEIYSYSEKIRYILDFRKPLDALPDLHKECLGRKINNRFSFRGEEYRIIRKIEGKT